MTKHKRKQWQWTKSDWAKQLFNFSRWLHVYLSTAIFSLLIFFSMTGFTLNHAHWFNSEGHRGIEKIMMPQELQSTLSNQNTLPVSLITAHIKTEYGLENPKSIDMDLDVGEISLDYPIPSGYVFITLFTESGEMEIEYQTGSLIALFNNLHKGRHSGNTWSLLIDISAWAMILFSLAGLFILLQHRKRRLSGLLTVLAGTLSPLLIYLLWVPSFH
jgi:uncharacterized protein